MKTGYNFLQSLFLALLCTMISTVLVRADGFIIIEPFHLPQRIEPLRLHISYHHVTTTINGAAEKLPVATTAIDQEFVNPYDFELAGTYVFPVPAKAIIHDFKLRVGEKELPIMVLKKKDALRTYQEFAQRHRDPALLEYVGRDMLKAQLPKIPAHSSLRVTISYTETLTVQDGSVKYYYTLGTEKFSASHIKDVSVDVSIKSSHPVTNVYSPTNPITVGQYENGVTQARYHATNTRPSQDFILYYTPTATRGFGISTLTYKESDDEGYFLTLLSAADYAGRQNTQNAQKSTATIAKNVIFVIDTSGSMGGSKIQQARDALIFCLNNLNTTPLVTKLTHPVDSFNIISFNSQVTTYKDRPQQATIENIRDAVAFTRTLTASGGTDINAALKAAFNQQSPTNSTNIIIFLTDGEPTVGECNIGKIIKNATGANGSNTRLFSFGVGDDVNTTLLDKISLDNKGTSDYVRPDQNIEAVVSSFYKKIANPALINIQLDFDGVTVSEMYPQTLPDIFCGGQVLVVGRYARGGNVTVTLNGDQAGRARSISSDCSFTHDDVTNDFLPRLWAGRKIAHLVDQIVLNGHNNEIIEEIVGLSRSYGIITPYTSFLTQSDDAAAFTRSFVFDEALSDAQSSLASAVTDQVGSASVCRAMTQKTLRESSFVSDSGSSFGRNDELRMRSVRARTFYKKGNAWIDGQHTDASSIKAIALFSKEYFDLLAAQPELGAYAALGNNVIIKMPTGSISIIDEDGGDEKQ